MAEMRTIEDVMKDIADCKSCTKYKPLCKGDCEICDCIHDSNLSMFELEFLRRITEGLSLNEIIEAIRDHRLRKYERQILLNTIEYFGPEVQVQKTIEELGELIVELARPEARSCTKHIVEEIADVRIMLDQLELMDNLGSELKKAREFKLDRLRKMIGMGTKIKIDPTWRVCENCGNEDDQSACEDCHGENNVPGCPTKWKPKKREMEIRMRGEKLND